MMDFEQQVSILNASPELHSHWYREQYPDVAMLGISPAEHYLRFGALLGRNPGKNFDTQYYLAAYPDVAKAGMNPLLHYILYGMAEERFKTPKTNTKDALLEQDIQERLVKHLWGGHSEPALTALEKIYCNESLNKDLRFLAAWQTARWHFFIENYQQALAIADLICTLGENYKKQRLTAMIYSFCYMAQNNNSAANQVLQDFLISHPDDSDMRLALANTLPTAEQRLAHINRVYLQHNLSPITLKDKTLPLSLENITASADIIDSSLKVSVIIPTFNSADKIGIAIDSLLAQSWKNLEIIVVDDCSTDATYDIAKAYNQKNPRVIALRQEKNGGAYIARNSGLAIATGDFITTHDGDDWSHPQKIEKQMLYLAQYPKVMGVCTFWIRARNSIHFTQNWRLNPYLTHWSHSSFLFRRKVVEDIGGWDNVIVGGDTEYIWRVEAKYGSWAVKNIMGTVPMAIALDDDASLTRSKATHVKTIHYGLRHIYRSNAKYWHTKNNSLKVDSDCHARPFPAPLSMLIRNPPTIKIDCLLVGDFSCLEHCQKAQKTTENKPEKEYALLHWTFFTKKEEELDPVYFNILASEKVSAVVYGQTLHCNEIIILDDELLDFVPEQLPDVEASNGLIYLGKSNSNVAQKKEKFLSKFKIEANLIKV